MAAPNSLFDLAARVINHTGRHLFLTGRAGTGKTTFLRYIQQTTSKKAVVVAPTGVAAMNAGGVTMHSFFQLPLGMYIADAGNYAGDEYSGQLVVNRHSLFRNMRITRDKMEIMRKLELLIIDEVSMLRADALDAIDAVLRHYRRNPRVPFGGVQVLFIGDLFQLPPVITNGESQLFYEHYRSPFFFDSKVIQEEMPLVIELKHIYRQRDENFIHILNAIRNNTASDEDLNILHQRYRPWQEPEDGVIVLTTHNSKADAINLQRLESLSERAHRFDATIKGDFYERAMPAEKSLQLKVGAQIMFIKNDVGDNRRYYNGKLAKVYHIGEDGDVWVRLAPSPGQEKQVELKLEHHTWRSIRYRYDSEKDKLEEEELGSFMQYPVRLAWAITIHKSQGLTFERAIIDAGQSFAAGQVYVALSRLTGLEGLVLHSRIAAQGIEMPEVIIEFCRREMQEEKLRELVVREEQAFAQEQMLRWFSFEKYIGLWQQHDESYAGRGIPALEQAIAWSSSILHSLQVLEQTAGNFRRQLARLMHPQADFSSMRDRIIAAQQWFETSLETALLLPLSDHYKEWSVRPRSKKYLTELKDLEAAAFTIKRGWKQARQLIDALACGTAVADIVLEFPEPEKSRLNTAKQNEAVRPKAGETFAISLGMYQEGRSIEEIAIIRSLTPGTVEGHLARFVPSGEVKVEDLVSPEHIAIIRKALQDAPDNVSTSILKEQLPEQITYGELRVVRASFSAQKAGQLTSGS